jgi:hypothetical protein
VESAIKAIVWAGGQIVPVEVGRDSQSSLPKTGPNAYLDDKATEL